MRRRYEIRFRGMRITPRKALAVILSACFVVFCYNLIVQGPKSPYIIKPGRFAVNATIQSYVVAHNASAERPSIVKTLVGYAIAYASDANGNSDIYVKYSQDMNNWSQAAQVTNSSSVDSQPSLVKTDFDVVVAYYSERDGIGNIYLSSSTSGQNWAIIGRASNVAIDTQWDVSNPSLVLDKKGEYWLFYVRHDHNSTQPSNQSLVVKRSSNCVEWSEAMPVTDETTAGQIGSVSAICDDSGTLVCAFAHSDTGRLFVSKLDTNSGTNAFETREASVEPPNVYRKFQSPTIVQSQNGSYLIFDSAGIYNSRNLTNWTQIANLPFAEPSCLIDDGRVIVAEPGVRGGNQTIGLTSVGIEYLAPQKVPTGKNWTLAFAFGTLGLLVVLAVAREVVLA